MGVGELLTGDDELLLLAITVPEIGQGTDSGEHVSQLSPGTSGDTATGADAAFLAITSTDTGTGADSNGSINSAVQIFDFDSSHAIVTTPAVDSDRGQFTDGKGSSIVDSDSGSAADASVLAPQGSDTGHGADGK